MEPLGQEQARKKEAQQQQQAAGPYVPWVWRESDTSASRP